MLTHSLSNFFSDVLFGISFPLVLYTVWKITSRIAGIVFDFFWDIFESSDGSAYCSVCQACCSGNCAGKAHKEEKSSRCEEQCLEPKEEKGRKTRKTDEMRRILKELKNKRPDMASKRFCESLEKWLDDVDREHAEEVAMLIQENEALAAKIDTRYKGLSDSAQTLTEVLEQMADKKEEQEISEAKTLLAELGNYLKKTGIALDFEIKLIENTVGILDSDRSSDEKKKVVKACCETLWTGAGRGLLSDFVIEEKDPEKMAILNEPLKGLRKALEKITDAF